MVCPDVRARPSGLSLGKATGTPNRESRDCAYQGEVMLAAIGAILLVLWLLGFVAFHITFGAIHLLLFAVGYVGSDTFRGSLDGLGGYLQPGEYL